MQLQVTHYLYREIKKSDGIYKLQSDLEAAGRLVRDWLMHFCQDKCNILSVMQKKKKFAFTYKIHQPSLAGKSSLCKILRPNYIIKNVDFSYLRNMLSIFQFYKGIDLVHLRDLNRIERGYCRLY